jgi:hypothetical protein
MTAPSGSGAYQWIVEVAGLGRTTGTFSDNSQRIRPLAMSTGGPERQAASARTLCDTYVACLVPGSIRFGSTGCNPLSGEFRSGTCGFQIVLDDARWPEVGRFFLSPGAARSIAARTGSNVTPSTISLNLDAVAGATLALSGIAANGIIYSGREALRVQTVGLFTVTVYNLMPDTTDHDLSADVTRSGNGVAGRIGHIGTRQERHNNRTVGELPPVPDDRWFTSTPFVSGREVTVYVKTDSADDAEFVVWRGFLSGSPRLMPDGVTLAVEAVDMLQGLSARKLNERPLGIVAQWLTSYDAPAIAQKRYWFMGSTPDLSQPQAEAQTLWGNPQASGASSFGFPAVLQVGKAALFVDQYNLTGGREIGYVYAGGPYRAVFGSESLPDAPLTSADRVFELLVSDPLDESSPVTRGQAIKPQDHPYWCDNLPDPSSPGSTTTGVLKHPLHMVLAHLGALACPNLPATWKIDLPVELIDSAGIIELARTTYSAIDAWPGVIGGQDGKAVKALGWLADQFLRPIGAAFALTGWADADTGVVGAQITVRSAVLSPEAIGPELNVEHIVWGRGAVVETGISADSVRCTAGVGLDGNPNLILLGDEVYESGFFPWQSSAYEFPGGGLVHPDDTGESMANYQRVRWVRRYIQTLATLFRYPLTVITREVVWTRPVVAGELVEMDAAVLFRSEDDGQLSGVTDDTKIALALSVGLSIEEALTQTVTFLVFPFTARRLGPAARVTTGSSTTVINCYDAVYVQQVNGDGEYAPGNGRSAVSKDVSTFQIGDIVVVRTQALAVATDPEEIVSIDAGSSPPTITLASGLTVIGGGGPYTPSDNDVVTLAQQADADSNSLQDYVYVGRDTYST